VPFSDSWSELGVGVKVPCESWQTSGAENSTDICNLSMPSDEEIKVRVDGELAEVSAILTAFTSGFFSGRTAAATKHPAEKTHNIHAIGKE